MRFNPKVPPFKGMDPDDGTRNEDRAPGVATM